MLLTLEYLDYSKLSAQMSTSKERLNLQIGTSTILSFPAYSELQQSEYAYKFNKKLQYSCRSYPNNKRGTGMTLNNICPAKHQTASTSRRANKP